MGYHGLVCVRDVCDEHKHRRHPGMGHCSGCVDESNEGYGIGFTFSSDVSGDDYCCCRDKRIGKTPAAMASAADKLWEAIG